VLVDLFERIENFFRRLESYTAVAPTAAMTDIIVKIMVEVLSILAIMTKEIKEKRASGLFLLDFSLFTYVCSREVFEEATWKEQY
jgi:hypothetical protein